MFTDGLDDFSDFYSKIDEKQKNDHAPSKGYKTIFEEEYYRGDEVFMRWHKRTKMNIKDALDRIFGENNQGVTG